MTTVPMNRPVLLPTPKNLWMGGGVLRMESVRSVHCPFSKPTCFDPLEWTTRIWREGTGRSLEMEEAGKSLSGGIALSIQREPDQVPGFYRLTVSEQGIIIQGSSSESLFQGIQTLKQLLRSANRGTLPCLEIVDWPDFPVRGVMLDISRNKVPRMETLFHIIDTLAEWKFNQLQLYTEHTFAYAGHEEVWEGCSPMTGEEIRTLDARCRERCMELVPNQNCFGHMERWLKHPGYADLAICGPDESFPLPWGGTRKGGFSLNPTDPRSIALVRDLHAQLLPHFTSRQFNVGCDETFDLGHGKTAALCREKGKGKVYRDFLEHVFASVREHGCRPQFWGDIILEHPEQIEGLPMDAVALAWGYESGFPFEEKAAAFAEAGLPFYVCPGTSSWLSIGGRTHNMLENQLEAGEAGKRHGAEGYLVTDWGDRGHWQYLPVSWLPFAAAANASWNGSGKRNRQELLEAVQHHYFRDASSRAAEDFAGVGEVWDGILPPQSNSTLLFKWLADASIEPHLEGIHPEAPEQIIQSLEVIMEAASAIRCPEATGPIAKELENAARMMRHACLRAQAHLKPDRKKTSASLSEDLQEILDQHRALWMNRNRPGGWEESSQPLRERLKD